MKTIALVFVCAVFAGALLLERIALTGLRAENAALVELKAEAERLAEENRTSPAIASPTASASVSELERLRAEVRRGQGVSSEIARLRADNARIAAELAAGSIKPRRLADAPGFIPRAQWVSGNFSTVENAAQSLMSAMLSQDVEQVFRCLAPKEAQEQRDRAMKDPEGFRKELAEESPATHATGLVIEWQKPVAEDAVIVSVKLSAEGDALPLPLRRIDGEWKLDPSLEEREP